MKFRIIAVIIFLAVMAWVIRTQQPPQPAAVTQEQPAPQQQPTEPATSQFNFNIH